MRANLAIHGRTREYYKQGSILGENTMRLEQEFRNALRDEVHQHLYDAYVPEFGINTRMLTVGRQMILDLTIDLLEFEADHILRVPLKIIAMIDDLLFHYRGQYLRRAWFNELDVFLLDSFAYDHVRAEVAAAGRVFDASGELLLEEADYFSKIRLPKLMIICLIAFANANRQRINPDDPRRYSITLLPDSFAEDFLQAPWVLEQLRKPEDGYVKNSQLC